MFQSVSMPLLINVKQNVYRCHYNQASHDNGNNCTVLRVLGSGSRTTRILQYDVFWYKLGYHDLNLTGITKFKTERKIK